MTRLGIGVDRWHHLRLVDLMFRAWSERVMPAVHDAIELQAMNEGLTWWHTKNLYHRSVYRRLPDRHELPTFHKYVHTPPARPEWLEVLA